jgi:2-dehydro-3-deoxyphosphogalactonate aldolase
MSREIVAILRGLTPPEAAPMAEALMEAGIERIELPLNSPDPYRSIGAMLRVARGRGAIGAGTVLAPEDVRRLKEIGARMVVSPDTNPRVIVATKMAGMESWPGVLTPTEAFTALRNGADGLKLFPAAMLGPAGLAALRAVLPAGTRLLVVGGVRPEGFAAWRAAGATGFGIGSALYAPGDAPADVAARAREMVAAFDELEAP